MNTTDKPDTFLKAASEDGVAHWARQVLDLQDACNASGVVHSLVDLMMYLGGSTDYKGTIWRNEHPLVVVVLDKLASLSRTQPVFPDRRVVDAFTFATFFAGNANQDQKDHLHINAYFKEYIEPVLQRRCRTAEMLAAEVLRDSAKPVDTE